MLVFAHHTVITDSHVGGKVHAVDLMRLLEHPICCHCRSSCLMMKLLNMDCTVVPCITTLIRSSEITVERKRRNAKIKTN